MTKSEETTAALIARLHEQLTESIQERDHWEAASDRWRAEEAKQRARAEKAEDELAKEKQRSSDQRGRGDALAERVKQLIRERDEARKTIAGLQLELDAKRSENERLREQVKETREQLAKLEWVPGMKAPRQCHLCDGVEPAYGEASGYSPVDIGHKPGCWFAKKDKRVIIPAANLTVPDLYMYISTGRSHKASARPEPRFKVGEKVSCANGDFDVRGLRWETGWVYWQNAPENPVPEQLLKPAPKFAVGEWVTINGGRRYGEIKSRVHSEITGQWQYDVDTKSNISNCPESLLTAQTPQHKHDCKGSIFLGRHEGFDLWWRPTMREVVAVEPAVAHCYSVDGELLSRNPLAIEARRRAVARGLVKP